MRHHWLKLSNTAYRSFSLHSLNSDEKWCWLTILCICSQKQSATVRFTEEWFEWETRIPIKTLRSCLEKLQCDSTATVLRHNCQTEKIREDKRREEKRGTKKSNQVSSKPAPLLNSVLKTYYDAYKLKYGIALRFTGKDIGILKRVSGSMGIDRMSELLQVYLQMDTKWFETKHHDLVTFEQNLTEIQVAHGSGKTTKQRKDALDWDYVFGEKKNDKGSIQNRDGQIEVGLRGKALPAGTDECDLENVSK
jgi:hypothetical protein